MAILSLVFALSADFVYRSLGVGVGFSGGRAVCPYSLGEGFWSKAFPIFVAKNVLRIIELKK